MNKKLILSIFLVFNLSVFTTKPILSKAISAVLIYRYIITPFFKAHSSTKHECSCLERINTIEQYLALYGLTLIDLKNKLETISNKFKNQQDQINVLTDLEITLEDSLIDTAKEIEKIENTNEHIIYRS